ncbi:hypothetical protein CR513_11527, partial [Mucuna pruriens]
MVLLIACGNHAGVGIKATGTCQTMPLQVKTPDLQSLRYLKGQWCKTFEGRYDNLLSLLEIKVQKDALDFQLMPALEEYERIIGMPLAKSLPFLFRGQYPSWALVAKLLKILESEVLGKKRNRNGLKGIPKIILFPHVEDYVDQVATDTFLAKKDRGENPVIAILVNTYYTLNYCYERNGKELRCCTSFLYLWLTAHLFHDKRRATCPIEDHHWSWAKSMSKAEWMRYLDEAFEKSIR